MSEQSLTRTVYREQIKEVLLERILDGVYPPGERIVETRVAREFGVSQGPVREALRELESLRLVVSEPFVGVRVRAVSPEELGEIYPVRSGLEEVAARTAAVAPRRPPRAPSSARSTRCAAPPTPATRTRSCRTTSSSTG